MNRNQPQQRARRHTILPHTHAQAALEFLVTYGWAILAVMIVIAALAYFGVFNASKYANNYCNFGDQWTCEDYLLQVDGTLSFKMRNNFGVSIDLTEITATYDTDTIACATSGPLTSFPPSTLIDVTCIRFSGLNLNDAKKITASITFKRTGSSSEHTQTGDIYTIVQP